MSITAKAGDILVVGAGPTGLATACTLLQHGVECRVVDRRGGPASEPKALILWSGALEILRRIGVAGQLRDRSLALAGASYWSRGRQVGAVRFGALEGTAFPAPLCVPQSVTESVLYERLLELGGQVDWNTEATGLCTVPPGGDATAEVTLAARRGERTEELAPRYLIAADGAHSRVREAVGIPFEGGSYARDFLLGDGEYGGRLPEDEVQYHLTPHGVLVVVPLPGGGHRIFFDREPVGETLPPDERELQRHLDERGPSGWSLERTWWRSTFRVHTKVAATFRRGGVFLAGDAAHCHSPAGGQGLNTGVQDGFDLGWKLAAVARGAAPELLDSYETERRPAALRALRNSDRQTRLWMLRSGPRRAVRDLVLTLATRSGALDRKLVPELAQIAPDLTASPAVPGDLDAVGGARPAPGPRPEAGRRLPDTAWEPLAGTRTRTAHGFLAAGRHALLVVTSGTPTGTAADTAGRLLRSVRQSPLAAQIDVLLLAGRDGDGVAEGGAEPGVRYAVAVESEPLFTRWAPDAPLVLYVRPDGVTAAFATATRWRELLRHVPTVRPDTGTENADTGADAASEPAPAAGARRGSDGA
ncbi:FAD-dependent monooxygenase [Streptomyces sp. NRRL B-24572]|uniref:FAD-dependent monooxygenase n=1 Tax=Streptomyces sp. NRRL B-24572 TaxID=1962156 RepID=UPI000D1B59DB|nr:FAD-dependent monooxygenase [Streptomyces sp. NRRL B-24572]